MSYLANPENVFVPASKVFGRTIEQDANSGEIWANIRSASIEFQLDQARLENNNENGASTLFTTRPKTKGGTLSLTLDLFEARHLAKAVMGTLESVEQTAETALTVTATSLKPGSIVKLDGKNVENVVVTDGSSNVIAEGAQTFVVDKKAGIVELRSEQATVEITFDRPLIESSEVINILDRNRAHEVIFTMRTTGQSGVQMLIENIRVLITPGAALNLIDQDADFGEIELNCEIVRNDLDIEYPFGKITYL